MWICNYERLVYYYSSLPLTIISSTDSANCSLGSNFVVYFVPIVVVVAVDATVAVVGLVPIAVAAGIVVVFVDDPAGFAGSCTAPAVGCTTGAWIIASPESSQVVRRCRRATFCGLPSCMLP